VPLWKSQAWFGNSLVGDREHHAMRSKRVLLAVKVIHQVLEYGVGGTKNIGVCDSDDIIGYSRLYPFGTHGWTLPIRLVDAEE
jgi:hypothetical protein